MDSPITIEEFVKMLCADIYMMKEDRILTEALTAGLIEPIDRVLSSELLERRAAARIVHCFLRLIIKEPDVSDWTPAKQLADLYDCRSCVNHVAQVYCKGIMNCRQFSDEICIFGMQDVVGRMEAEEIIERIFEHDKRYKMKTGTNCG